MSETIRIPWLFGSLQFRVSSWQIAEVSNWPGFTSFPQPSAVHLGTSSANTFSGKNAWTNCFIHFRQATTRDMILPRPLVLKLQFSPFTQSCVYSFPHETQCAKWKVPCASTILSPSSPATLSSVSMFWKHWKEHTNLHSEKKVWSYKMKGKISVSSLPVCNVEEATLCLPTISENSGKVWAGRNKKAELWTVVRCQERTRSSLMRKGWKHHPWWPQMLREEMVSEKFRSHLPSTDWWWGYRWSTFCQCTTMTGSSVRRIYWHASLCEVPLGRSTMW